MKDPFSKLGKHLSCHFMSFHIISCHFMWSLLGCFSHPVPCHLVHQLRWLKHRSIHGIIICTNSPCSIRQIWPKRNCRSPNSCKWYPFCSWHTHIITSWSLTIFGSHFPTSLLQRPHKFTQVWANSYLEFPKPKLKGFFGGGVDSLTFDHLTTTIWVNSHPAVSSQPRWLLGSRYGTLRWLFGRPWPRST